MINAAFALDLGVMWRTGSPAYQSIVMRGLGLEENEKIVGFLYLGTKTRPEKPRPDTSYSDLVSEWDQDG